MPEDTSGYREQDGCWNCKSLEDFYTADDVGDYHCEAEQRRESKRHKCPEVSPGGICRYHQKEAE